MEHYAYNVEGYFDGGDFDLYAMVVSTAPETAHFVEIGAWKGRSTSFMAVEIINSGKNIRFDVVDTFIGSEEMMGDPDAQNGTLFQTFLRNMAPVEGHYNPLKMESTQAASLYADNSLDFVFIDASHDYESVKADILAWAPKVKPKGILAGHDYPHEPVARAVNDYGPSGTMGIQGACWFIVKQ